MYLPLIQDFGLCRTLAWGSAVLAFLYRELCKASMIGVEENAGCLILFQLWAWTRLPTLAPVPRGPSLDNPAIWGGRPGPYGMRWCSHLSFTDTSSRVLSTHHLSLDGLAPSHFIWQPYTIEILAALPHSCVDGTAIWCYKGPLICFHIVEPHVPNRCMRQFGLIQDIPSNDPYSKELLKIKLQGKQDSDWGFMHRDHISHWARRLNHVISDIIGVGVIDGYDQWYARITRLYHTRVGGSHLFAVQLLEHISLVAKGVINGDMGYIDSIASNGRQLLQDQFNHGVFQDFPIEDRREKEIEIKKKLKKVGHKGGRGGVNVPRRSGIHVDDNGGFHLDEEGNDVGDREGIHLGAEGGFVGETSTQVHENQAEARQPDLETRVLTSLDYCPNWNLLSSDDSQFLTPHSPQQSRSHKEQAVNEHSPPLSSPTFDLGISQPLQQPASNKSLQNQQVENLSGPHQPELQQRQPAQQQQQQPHLLPLVQQNQSYSVQEQPPVVQQQPPKQIQRLVQKQPLSLNTAHQQRRPLSLNAAHQRRQPLSLNAAHQQRQPTVQQPAQHPTQQPAQHPAQQPA